MLLQGDEVHKTAGSLFLFSFFFLLIIPKSSGWNLLGLLFANFHLFLDLFASQNSSVSFSRIDSRLCI